MALSDVKVKAAKVPEGKNQIKLADSDIIERQLAHKEGNAIRKHTTMHATYRNA